MTLPERDFQHYPPRELTNCHFGWYSTDYYSQAKGIHYTVHFTCYYDHDRMQPAAIEIHRIGIPVHSGIFWLSRLVDIWKEEKQIINHCFAVTRYGPDNLLCERTSEDEN